MTSRSPSPSMPSTVPSGAHATARSPKPTRSTAWWWKEFTRERLGAEDRRQPRARRRRARVCVSSQPGAVWRWSIGVVGDRRQVLVQRPAAGDVERLRAAADAEDRQAHGVGDLRHLELEDVQRGLGRPELGRRRGAVGGGIEVRAAAQAHPAQRREQLRHDLDAQRRKHDRHRAGPRERAHVRHPERHLVLRRLALGQGPRPLRAPDLGRGHADQWSPLPSAQTVHTEAGR